MDAIQEACELLAGHQDSSVQEVASVISTHDLARDREMVVLQARLSTATAQIKTLRAEVRRQAEIIAKLKAMHFGQASEKTSKRKRDVPPEDQPQAPEFDEPEDDAEDSANNDAPQENSELKKARGKRGRQQVLIPAHLRRETIVIEPKDGPPCMCERGASLAGEQRVERLAYKPAEVYVIEEVYPKYCCRKCSTFFQAKAPERVFDYSRFDDTMSLAAVISKFADFLPHYRLQEIFGRSGLKINRSTLWRLAKRTGDVLRPLYDLLISDLRQSGKLFMDETRAPLQAPGLGKTKTAYMWAMTRDDRRWKGNRPPAVAFRFAQTREGVHGESFLGNFAGTLQVDGYAGYKRLTAADRVGAPLVLAYCWAHVRRKFFEAWKSGKSEKAFEIVETIDDLFAIERGLKGQPHVVRQAERARQSAPIVDALFKDLEALSSEIMMNSLLGEAINYTMKLREGLKVFLTDGRVEIDNNPVENVIRPLALIRKNSLFAGSLIGGEIWAILSSLLGTCKLNGLEPYAYLQWVFEKIRAKTPLADYHKLLPWNCPLERYTDDAEEPKSEEADEDAANP
ncbi:IS66 family transposase (plasmid) [Thioclava litoralis]|uniref:IS66 family transposase n=1 Tax=Thioclava litoralis TaxID=3076557 RepID=A0ABZ1E2Z6_9RHOB|nr:IS66 family transposase [Thioclava sp. FTW29]